MYLLAKRGDVRPVVVTESAGLENGLRFLRLLKQVHLKQLRLQSSVFRAVARERFEQNVRRFLEPVLAQEDLGGEALARAQLSTPETGHRRIVTAIAAEKIGCETDHHKVAELIHS